MLEREVVKDGICYMCCISCPTKIHVRLVRTIHIDMIDRSALEKCSRDEIISCRDLAWHENLRGTHDKQGILEKWFENEMTLSFEFNADKNGLWFEEQSLVSNKMLGSNAVF